MKKLILLLIAFFAISININADSRAKCLLHHQGTVKVFDGEKIEAAIKASADGDTIFLSEGTFPGFTINKKITIRGAGQESRINSEIKINLNNNPTLTQTLLEWLNMDTHSITVESSMKKLKIKQCRFNRLATNANNIEDVLVDRCFISDCIRGFKSATIVNSKIFFAYDDCGHEYFNCNIKRISGDALSGNFTNCIFGCGTGYYISNCFFNNCLFNGEYSLESSSSAKNCWVDNNFTLDLYTLDSSLGKYDLEDKGYIGTDGTVVGIEGGSAPFTLEPSVPKVTNSTVAYDAANKLLKVNLTVTTNKE